MGAFASLDALINNLTGGDANTPHHPWAYIDGRIQAAAATAPVAGRINSLWQYNKTNGANGAVPPALAAAAAPTNATIGAWPVPDPGVGNQHWLLGVEATMNAAGALVLYDRLVHCTGASGIVTTAQAITGGAVTRYTGAESVGNKIHIEIHTAIGATATTATVSYTNQAGVAGRTTKAVAIGGTGLNTATTIIPCPLADGDTGVQSVQSVTLAGTTATAGSFGVLIVRPLGMAIVGGPASGTARDMIAGLPSLPEIKAGACLFFEWFANTTTVPAGMIGMHVGEA